MATTIKVNESTRDRIKAIGASTHQTADEVVAQALREYERALFWQAYRRAAEAEAGSPESAGPDGDRALWDRTLRDGLSDG